MRVRFFDRMMRGFDAKGFADWRRRLVGDLEGEVVELGTGTGLNFGYYPTGAHVLASDRDPMMLSLARVRAPKVDATVSLTAADAMRLPFEDASADAVVISLMLCSVPDQALALQEVRRVLKPGGRFRFVEHVRDVDGSRNARFQDRWNPVYKRFSGGCNWNRRTFEAVEAAGFRVAELTRFREGPKPTAPHVIAEATL